MIIRSLLKILVWVCLFGAVATHAAAQSVISVTQINYDEHNRPMCTTTRMNPAAYSALPADACTLGPAGSFGPDRVTKSTYDAAGELIQVDQGYGTSVQRAYARYTYTNNGLKRSEKDANGNLTLLSYDVFDRLIQVTYPSTALGSGVANSSDYEWYTYDNNGNRASLRRRDGNWIYFTYDPLNRQITKDIPGGTAKDVYTGYDLLGNVTYRRFASTSGPGVTYAYDSLDRLQSTTDMNGKTVGYLYNEASARTRLTFPDANWQPYTLDNLNRVTFTGMGVANVTLTYDSLGSVIALSRANGAPTAMNYDAAGRLYSLTQDLAGTGYDIGWTFSGRNPANQVTRWSASTTVYDYRELASATDNLSYDGLNRDVGIAALSGGYDARGNLTFDGTRTFTYDIENRLLTAVGGGANLNLVYDPEGRLAKYSTNGGTNYTTFLYDGVNLIGEYDSAGTMQRRYVHGPGTDQPLIQFNSAAVGTLSAVSYIYTNYQGSVVALADSAGYVTDYYKYGPYGEPRNAYNTENFYGSRFRYTGQIALPEAKLYYYKARVYDPKYGRFLQTDPIGSKDDLDLYAFVAGDPINGVDPTGEALVFAPGSNDTFKAQFGEMIKYLNQNGEAGTFAKLQKSADVFTIQEGISLDDFRFEPDTKTLVINPLSGLEVAPGQVQTPALGAKHEADHALHYLEDPTKSLNDAQTPVQGYDNEEERRTIVEDETPAAQKMGEPTRTDHGGSAVPVSCPTCQR